MNKEDILNWFYHVCDGIRQEYETGASIRSYYHDENSLSMMLDSFIDLENKQNEN